MKILYDHQIFLAQKFGGISRYFNELMQIGQNGIEVKKIEPSFFDSASPVYKRDVFSRGIRYLKRRTFKIEDNPAQGFQEKVADLFSSESYDILHPTYYDPYFLELNKKPFTLTVYDMIHEIFMEYFPLIDRTSHNKRILCQKANKIIAISQTTKNDLIQIFGLPEEKIHAIPLASDFDTVEPVQPENTEDLKRYILFVGVRGGYKNFYFSMTALAELVKQDKDLQVLCTGHPFTPEELSFFQDLGISKQVKHLYLKDDRELAWAYQNAALFIFPSLYEGFGFPLLEAFASKCPVISSRGGSLIEVGGDATLYFDPKSISQIQDAAYQVLYNNQVKVSLIEKGLLQFKKYNWNSCRQKTIEVYKSVHGK